MLSVLLPCLYSFTLFTAALGDKPKQSITLRSVAGRRIRTQGMKSVHFRHAHVNELCYREDGETPLDTVPAVRDLEVGGSTA